MHGYAIALEHDDQFGKLGPAIRDEVRRAAQPAPAGAGWWRWRRLRSTTPGRARGWLRNPEGQAFCSVVSRAGSCLAVRPGPWRSWPVSPALPAGRAGLRTVARAARFSRCGRRRDREVGFEFQARTVRRLERHRGGCHAASEPAIVVVMVLWSQLVGLKMNSGRSILTVRSCERGRPGRSRERARSADSYRGSGSI